MHVDPATLPWRESYKLLIGSVLPRPIAWVSTVNTAGQTNLAPFSFFMGVCPEPFTIAFAPMVRGSDGGEKDTLRNIRATGEFVVNVVTAGNLPLMNITATEFPPDVSEFAAAQVTPVASLVVKPPRVQESPINLECRLHQLVELGDQPGAATLVLGRVVMIHVADELYQNGRIDQDALDPVGRLAGDWYATIRDRFELKRPR
jgi:flavin reductase (DIM6/NTAB) family NADH-FMN oxidoreductase RutF